ncbi:SIS domain-containing protein [Lactiplantibacillus plantarum]|uniref:6-phospho-3-hexuloisomerase n=1 Tax=Lactiplantibacillus plantarum TaxID=1590 RepID=UPI00209CE566|nr:6-phospho-3-hexuloisomerase [Lactiplantibacillus plantarum]USZ60681.1 SIS domain-containing protein [Lactiplantibacillus plantarum]
MTENYTIKILKELSDAAPKISSEDLKQIVAQIVAAKHIFLAGAGRSGVAIQAFTNRLLHLGLDVSVIGEISSPHSHPDDLLIICSGSGETASLKNLAKSAKDANVRIALLTTKPDSTIGKLADSIVQLPGKSKTDKTDPDVFSQPMGSEFEQLAFLTFDGIVMNLMDVTGETSETMFARHADFE